MKPTDQTKEFVIKKYVNPARLNGENVVQVRVGTVQKGLGWTNRAPSVFSTLSSREFQQEAGLELIEKKGGPPSGGPSTTVQFVYRLLKEGDRPQSPQSISKPSPYGAGLDQLYGILKDAYAELGGGEAYLRAERDWGPDAWEKYERQQGAHKENRK
jgi:hypothetical protein